MLTQDFQKFPKSPLFLLYKTIKVGKTFLQAQKNLPAKSLVTWQVFFL
jgi:hypothetical protein